MATVYDPHNANAVAHCIYFYHLSDSPDAVKAYVVERAYALTRNNVEAEIRPILADIGAGKLKPSGWGLGDIRWRRKSFLIVVLEDAHQGMTPRGAITFEHIGGTGPAPTHDNHTFRDGWDITPFGNFTGVICFDHMVSAEPDRHVLGDGEAEFFNVRTHHERRADRESPDLLKAVKILTHEDTGSNTGPTLA